MLLRVKVKPGSKADEIIREADGTLKIKIREQPVEGKANKYLVKFLGDILNLSKSKIVLTKGEGSSFKTLKIDAEDKYVLDILSKF